MKLTKLSEPFESGDIEWRVSRAGLKQGKPWCLVLAYVTARAIQKRLDDVCGPDGWRVEEPRVVSLNGKDAFACGLSIRIGDDWITKWDVCEPTQIEPAKGGWSGALKRAGAQWGIGRYLYHLDETFAEVSDTKNGRAWNYAKLPKDKGGEEYYWKAPGLPGWALPKDEQGLSAERLTELKKKFAESQPDVTEPVELRESFVRFVKTHVGEFPVHDISCWTVSAYEKCLEAMSKPSSDGIDGTVPFE